MKGKQETVDQEFRRKITEFDGAMKQSPTVPKAKKPEFKPAKKTGPKS
jgi:hypothetical protein